jgi:hypothetical protein
MNDVWDKLADNEFASQIYDLIDTTTVMPTRNRETILCFECHSTSIWSDHVAVERETQSLRHKASRCELCALLFRIARGNGRDKDEVFRLYRFGSEFRLDTTGPTVLSICTNAGMF